MKNRFLLLGLFLLPALLSAQYEQKISVNLSAGGFKTFGNKYNEETGPMQMPNYKVGFAANGGIQFKIGEHFSVSAEFGIMMTNLWNYKTPDKDNWLYWTIDDTTTWQVLAEGEDYLDLRNYSISVKPKYYLGPGKKLNPYFYTGVNINWTGAWFENNLWAAQKKLGLLAPEDTEPYNDNLENSFGIGLNPGFGIEFSPGDQFHFYFETGYYLISLQKENFKDPAREENFNAVLFQVGLRLNFIKSKEL
jgi:opacity protein-like surface antigen